ncbi:unnamed protein product [Darwinula stevensoni]|uniref:Uncharacterized protein n=1 Tax=Darwinula stevensoni TaxID=69355 RepID=A0A7R8XB12_9CRUS|nr:unnamed protein product [Darwinula stevensoni]CAG0892405.1 unnamed protein product [Darwinula stevensoni]
MGARTSIARVPDGDTKHDEVNAKPTESLDSPKNAFPPFQQSPSQSDGEGQGKGEGKGETPEIFEALPLKRTSWNEENTSSTDSHGKSDTESNSGQASAVCFPIDSSESLSEKLPVEEALTLNSAVEGNRTCTPSASQGEANETKKPLEAKVNRLSSFFKMKPKLPTVKKMSISHVDGHEPSLKGKHLPEVMVQKLGRTRHPEGERRESIINLENGNECLISSDPRTPAVVEVGASRTGNALVTYESHCEEQDMNDSVQNAEKMPPSDRDNSSDVVFTELRPLSFSPEKHPQTISKNAALTDQLENLKLHPPENGKLPAENLYPPVNSSSDGAALHSSWKFKNRFRPNLSGRTRNLSSCSESEDESRKISQKPPVFNPPETSLEEPQGTLQSTSNNNEEEEKDAKMDIEKKRGRVSKKKYMGRKKTQYMMMMNKWKVETQQKLENDTEPSRKSLTMRDLINYNPNTTPMPRVFQKSLSQFRQL